MSQCRVVGERHERNLPEIRPKGLDRSRGLLNEYIRGAAMRLLVHFARHRLGIKRYLSANSGGRN